ncbi:flagellar basal-body MS-ring/collar protein FliF [Rhodobacter calidifons]|uniref:Flagellar M-ring protein n=1 Tax=Rhodobacter calidifons TaxID=2715277 RepID=A0ABX0G6C2_9RHOB|nr:flagellar basal-body MS-ring/collar protein FliF [Rhodobacter calidifons]NHB76641.1 flagellar M-ring protein FliF [Rhodobacter calidifons]
MQNLIAIWTSLDLRRRIIILGATLAMFAAVLALSRMAGRPEMGLLYAGLEPAAAGEVVAALDQQGVAYEIRGDSILVDVGQRDGLRMALAADGLPAAGGGGYELLDSLSGFGTTSQMFDAAYWRAKEGEIARTLLAMPQVRAARVHIASAPTRTFRPDGKPTASVTLTTASGRLDEGQARAIRHLVASAVAGMTPDAVQIIDTVAGLIGAGDVQGIETGNADDRAAVIKGNVERLLSARVGPGKAIVEVAIELNSDRESITERKFDPQGRVAISLETEERSGTSTEPGGAVTVASNLPEGDATAGGQGKSQSSETRERVNYEVSETQREILRNPGAIRRMTVAVMVDGVVTTQADGTRSWAPRSEEELSALRELVASAVGLDEARGDVLTLKSLEFQELPLPPGTEASASILPPFGQIDVMTMIQTAVLALVALVLGLFVIRPVLSSANRPALPVSEPPLALPPVSTAEGMALTGEVDDGLDYGALAGSRGESFGDFGGDDSAEDPATRLRRLIEQRQTESIEILRGWMEHDEEHA